MPVTASDFKVYKSLVITNTTANGGGISSNEVVDNVVNNGFSNVTDAERQAGGTRYRKFFLKNINSLNIALLSVAAFLGSISSAADYFQIIAGNDTDTQAEADDYTAWKGTGYLDTGISAGGTSLVVNYETSSGVANADVCFIRQIKLNLTNVNGVFEDDEKIIETGGAYGWINNAQSSYLIMNLNKGIEATATIIGSSSGATATVDSIETLTEYVDVSNVSWASNQATVTVSTLVNTYLSGAIVSSLVSLDNLTPALSDWTETSTSGTYDETTYPVILYNIGTVSDDWTLTFSDSSNFSVSGSITGSVGSGNTGSDFQPAHGASYYFKIASAGWGGTWADGDTVEFTTIHSARSVWLKETWAAGVASGCNDIMLSRKGESA